MLVLAVDWATISALATATGTLVLAVATFAAVRSSNRSARIAELALQEQRRPVLTGSRISDPPQKLMFADGHWVNPDGGHGTAEHIDGIVYLSISLRNVGSGIARFVTRMTICEPLSQRRSMHASRSQSSSSTPIRPAGSERSPGSACSRQATRGSRA
jgi:hypothetical protein